MCIRDIRKSLDLPTNFSIVNSASEAVPNRLSVVNCTDDEVKVEFSKPDVYKRQHLDHAGG